MDSPSQPHSPPARQMTVFSSCHESTETSRSLCLAAHLPSCAWPSAQPEDVSGRLVVQPPVSRLPGLGEFLQDRHAVRQFRESFYHLGAISCPATLGHGDPLPSGYCQKVRGC